MIQSFKNKETERLFRREPIRTLSPGIQRVALRKLVMIDAASDIRDLRVPPGNHLELLSGKRKGQFSIRINDQWRICFLWHNNHTYEIEIVDYH
jgi:proteic killer suppression protein